VHAILRAIVNMVLNGEDCVALQRYIVLKREIMTTAAGALDGMRDDARKMVAGMVEMERSYLTAEVFREILASSHAVDELSEEVHVRRFSALHHSPPTPCALLQSFVGNMCLALAGRMQSAFKNGTDSSDLPTVPLLLQTGLTLTLDGRRMVDVINEGPEEDRHLRTIAAHTSAYITHVRRQLRHTVPKAIVHCLVRG